jgi:hypothetical protein
MGILEAVKGQNPEVLRKTGEIGLARLRMPLCFAKNGTVG